MKTITFTSKRHGTYTIKVDNSDFNRIKELGGKWCVVIKRGNPYFQKRFPGDYIKEIHRWIMGDPPGKYVDHINGNTLDNRKRNLRSCSNAANIRNGKVRTNNTSGYTGVYFDKRSGKWGAAIKVMYKTIRLGVFDLKKDAIKVRKNAEKRYFLV